MFPAPLEPKVPRVFFYALIDGTDRLAVRGDAASKKKRIGDRVPITGHYLGVLDMRLKVAGSKGSTTGLGSSRKGFSRLGDVRLSGSGLSASRA